MIIKWVLKIIVGATFFAFLLILGALAIEMWHRSKNESNLMDVVTIDGLITPDTFVDIKEFMINSTRSHKRVVINSGGGDGESALAIGMLVHKYQWDVEVKGQCSSACANYIFPAGKAKYLNEFSVLLFHGGFHQENQLEYARRLDEIVKDSDNNLESTSFGVPDYEGQLNLDIVVSKNRLSVREYLSLDNFQTIEEQFRLLRGLSDKFYEEIGVNNRIATLGQEGIYKDIYLSYKYKGFTYSIESLENLGITNIVVLGGQWHPEKNELYKELYEVSYP